MRSVSAADEANGVDRSYDHIGSRMVTRVTRARRWDQPDAKSGGRAREQPTD